jgi:hypothetical protein
MGRYDSHKNPFQYRISSWANKKTNDYNEVRPKSIPCHVQKVDKDFIHVAFETANQVFTPPVVKIPQSWSQYSREPTQQGDKGYAVPGHYYLGGVTDDSGGNTDFYPRGNLTTLSFMELAIKRAQLVIMINLLIWGDQMVGLLGRIRRDHKRISSNSNSNSNSKLK